MVSTIHEAARRLLIEGRRHQFVAKGGSRPGAASEPRSFGPSGAFTAPYPAVTTSWNCCSSPGLLSTTLGWDQ